MTNKTPSTPKLEKIQRALKMAQHESVKYAQSLEPEIRDFFWKTRWMFFQNPFQSPTQIVVINFDGKEIRIGLTRQHDRPNLEVITDVSNGDYIIKLGPIPLKELDNLLVYLAQGFIRTWEQQRAVQIVRDGTDSIRSQIPKISNDSVRQTMDKTAEQIQKALQIIEQQDKQLSEIRRLIGLTEGAKDLRLIGHDVEGLKRKIEQAVSKDIFESEIKRLDQSLEEMNRSIDRFFTSKSVQIASEGVKTRRWHFYVILVMETIGLVYLFLKVYGFVP